jgi:23S rRNA (adenine1618-N6)-methyltransferase
VGLRHPDLESGQHQEENRRHAEAEGLTPARPPPRADRDTDSVHLRNRHQDRYDFARLTLAWTPLKAFLVRTPDGSATIDFADPSAVRALNRALLQSQYGIREWQFPDGYLCPPIPGRADYLHGLADLLAESNGGAIPRGPSVRVLDIGTGASCIYPLLGRVEYGWHFVGTEIDRAALASATAIVAANPELAAHIELRLQPDSGLMLKGTVREGERFDLTLCNPPFHASAAEAAQASAVKWQKLGRAAGPRARPQRNFGGQSRELWCRGGEVAFVRRLIDESVDLASSVYWFTSLIAKGAHLASLKQHLKKVGAREVRSVAMAHGQKQSRFLAWSFLDSEQRATWRRERWA